MSPGPSWRRWTELGASVLAGAMMAIAALATWLGLDQNVEWGPGRRLLFACGLLVLGVAQRGQVAEAWRWLARAPGRLSTSIEQWAISNAIVAQWNVFLQRGLRPLIRATHVDHLARELRALAARGLSAVRASPVGLPMYQAFEWAQARQTRIRTLLVGMVVLAVSVWFISVGYWTRWPRSSAYYDLQAEAFVHGQVHLLEEPTGDLLALSDPYDPSQRQGLHYLWDASLYGGKYYLYWGPVPSVGLAVLKLAGVGPIGDHLLTFVFVALTQIFAALLILRIWEDYFTALPWWTAPIAVAVSGLANPLPWLLNNPWIYESAIAGGQAFLMAGLFLAYPALVRGHGSAGRLFLAGISWAMALGTRLSLLPAIGILVLLTFVASWRPGRVSGRILWLATAALMIPLLLGMGALGAYNFARFGSVLEGGHRYQLTSLNLNQPSGLSLSLANVPPNTYNYLFNPVRYLPVFPFIKPQWGGSSWWTMVFPAPEGYYSRQISGILLTIPFSWFSGLALVRWIRDRRSKEIRPSSSSLAPHREGLHRLVTAFGGATILQVGMVFAYVVASMRYIADFLPCLVLLSAIGFGQAYLGAKEAGSSTGVLRLTAWTTGLASVACGVLLGVTSSGARFEVLNPELFQWMTRLLAW